MDSAVRSAAQRPSASPPPDRLILWPRSVRLPKDFLQHQGLFGDYPQQPVFFATGAAGVDPQPHPEPPVAFTSASRAQQASVPVGAEPPQHVFGADWCWAVEALGRDAS